MSARRWRFAAFVVPAMIAALVTLPEGSRPMLHVIGPMVLGLWFVMASTLACVVLFGSVPMAGKVGPRSPWERLDLLTSTGAAMLWTGAGALVTATVTGWASLSVVGVLGLAVVYVVVTLTALLGDARLHAATISRAILPASSVEGDPLREELRLSVRIPLGTRLFATGQVMPHGPTSRYVVDARASGADLVLESELGPAQRGEHGAAPLTLWLGDILGLTRTPCVARGEASFTVLPRVTTVDNVRELLATGGDDAISRQVQQFPTEGTFRIREYTPGDDTRRIHWVRSLQQDQLIVRLPDEIPPAEPEIRLILDCDLSGTELLSCRAPHELLDGLVRVWLGIGKTLAASGTRVTLVTVASTRDGFAVIERPLMARSGNDGAQLGARVAWQGDVRLPALLGPRGCKQVIVSSRPRRMQSEEAVTWVVVPEIAWTSPEPDLPQESRWTLPFPSGSADNRLHRRQRERLRVEGLWNDRALFTGIVCWTDWATFSGDYYARPTDGRIALAVIP